jgi:hypothetical protein
MVATWFPNFSFSRRPTNNLGTQLFFSGFKTHITYIGNRIPKEQGKGIIQKMTESKDKSKLTCQNGDIVKTSELPYL